MSENPDAEGFGPDDTYISAEVMPEYPGGNQAVLEYLRTQIKYPTVCRENRIEGRVVVSFTINKDGSVTDCQVVRGVHPALDSEAVRVVSNMQAWRPGYINGNPVRVRYSIPINFRLN